MSISSFSDSSDFVHCPIFVTEEDQYRRLLRKSLSRFKKIELLKYIWEDNSDFCRIIPKNYFEKSKNMVLRLMINITIERILKKTSIDDFIGKLDLLYVVLYSEQRTWHGYYITKLEKQINEDEHFQKRLKESLLARNIDIRHSFSRMHMESLWLRLSIRPRPTHGRTHITKDKVLYIQYYTGLRFLFINGILMKDDMNTLRKALCSLFGSPDVQPMELKGSDLGALTIMAFQKHEHVISDAENLPPSLKMSLKPRSWSPDIMSGSDMDRKSLRRRHIKKAFGEFQAPTLKKFCVRTTFKMFPSETDEEDPTTSEITFNGDHVIEGLCDMYNQGKIHGKVPIYLENVATLGADTIYFSD